MERPERIHASILGISSAYVLLGGRYSAGKDGPHPDPTANPPPFAIHKTSRIVSLTSPAVTNVHGTKWMAELKVMCEGAEARLAANGKELVRPTRQSNDEDDEDKTKLHEGDLYLCSESLNALEGALGGVLEAVDIVFGTTGPQRSFVCVRPPGHHCSDNYPSGFCWLNNVHVGISHAAMAHGLTHAAIIDFDLHHGDGSQSIAWDHNSKVATLPKNASMSKKTAIGYFSLHDINSYPCEWGDEDKVRNASLCIEDAHGQTVWNVHLQPWKTIADFWNLYETRYAVLLEKTRAFLMRHSDKLRAHPQAPPPRAAILISAGFDASEWEGHGMQRHKVNVPTEFYARLTRDIIALSDEEGLGVNGRVISVLEGGYSDRALMSGVLSHMCGLTTTNSGYQTPDSSVNGLGQEMSVRLGNLGLEGQGRQRRNSRAVRSYDPLWWSRTRLEQLENLVDPPLPATGSKKLRAAVSSTYNTPTQSFAAKVVVPPASRRSLSSSMTSPQATSDATPKASALPPPDVDWATASYELSRLLIPTNRQTRSCKPEDLNAEATRARKIRQSGIGVVSEPIVDPIQKGKRMQLRDRKSRAPMYKTDEEIEPGAVSRVDENRRRTIGGVESFEKASTNPDSGAPKPEAPARRRVSVASTILSAGDDVSDISTAGRLESLAIPKSRSPSKTRVARKVSAQPPVPRVPSSYKRPSSSSIPQRKPSSRQSSVAATTNASVASTNAQPDMDSLASGMKKMNIKLKVPPKEEQEAREAKRKAAPKAPRKAAVPRAPKKTVELASKASSETSTQPPATRSIVPSTDSTKSTPTETPFVPNSLPQELAAYSAPTTYAVSYTTTSNSDPLPPSFMPPLSSSILAPTSDSSTSLSQPPSNAPIDIPPMTTHLSQPLAQREPQPTKAEQPPAEKISSPSEFVNPLSPKRGKENLPVFTPTSSIVFGRPSSMGGNSDVKTIMSDGRSEKVKVEDEGKKKSEAERDKEAGIWDVPDTPQQWRGM